MSVTALNHLIKFLQWMLTALAENFPVLSDFALNHFTKSENVCLLIKIILKSMLCAKNVTLYIPLRTA